MDKLAPFLTVLAMGVMVALQGPTNAMVGRSVAAPAFAALLSLAVSAAIMAALLLVTSNRPQLGALAALPWYGWLAGLYGAAIVLGAMVAVPKLGAGPALVAALVAQTVVGLGVDHLGLFGLPRSPVTPLKLGGLGVMAGGALMIAARR